MNPWILELFPQLTEKEFRLPVSQSGLDSFDLLALRSHLERKTGKKIPDAEWVKIPTLAALSEFISSTPLISRSGENLRNAKGEREYLVNMPQMAIGGLSEQWLFKEMGDLHWRVLAAGLGTPSNEIIDSQGNRLYATFVRIRWEGSHHLKMFRENESIVLQNTLQRQGSSFFFSEFSLRGEEKNIQAALTTTFAMRQKKNTELLRGEPNIPANCVISELASAPSLMEEYRLARKSQLQSVQLANYSFSTTANSPLATLDYSLNPYADMNGVNLLYFAAYPMIHDICERELAHNFSTFTGDWSLASSTIARDIFYFANCELSDRLRFEILNWEKFASDKVAIRSVIHRQSDNQKLAEIYTIKFLLNHSPAGEKK